MIKSKKIISITAAAVLSFSAFAFAGCGDESYKGEDTDGFVAGVKDDVSSNGGFLVEKGDYVYFINGQEANTADNAYGTPVKGSLMRISKADLAAGKGEEAKIIVPSLMVSGSYDSGIYIYGDYVYYATPTTDKDKDGNVANSALDFKRAKLDGSEAPMGGKNDYFFRLSSNTVKYRFVEDNDKVYCLYEEDGKLKSYNVESGETTVLVSGATSYFYDVQDLASPVVYYTMSVSQDIDKATPISQAYNQVFSVRAGNVAEVNSEDASYKAKTATGEVIAEYNFDEEFLKENEEEMGYTLSDYTTYPYVNLGELVLDGIGSKTDGFPSHVVLAAGMEEAKAQAQEPSGYTYTLQQQTKDGLYFTRSALLTNESATINDLYFIPHARGEWNSITGNAKGQTQTVSKDATSASATALFEINEGTHSYIYLDGTVLKRVKTDKDGNVTETVELVYNVSSITLWKTEGDYLYYYGSGTNGKNLIRVNYKGAQSDYNPIYKKGEYVPVTLALVDWSDSWYKPETIMADGQTILLYPNAQSFGTGGTALNYIYATKFGSNADITARNEKIEEVETYIEEYSQNSALQALMTCYFRTGNAATYDTDEEVRALYSENQVEEFDAFKAKFESNEFSFEKEFIYLVGRVNEADEEAMQDGWAASLLQETSTGTDDEGLETWAIVLIVCGSVLLVAIVITVPVVISLKRKKERKRKEEAIVSAYKRKKIDTTDDKSIDVYADEEPTLVEETAEEPATEEAEAPVQE